MSKKKGGRLERELFHLLYESGWSPIRVAGSGSVPVPSADIIAGKAGRVVAIECKSGKSPRYINKKQIQELQEFADKFGAEPWVGARFDNIEWFFLELHNLKSTKTGNNFVVDINLAKKKGIKFDELLGKYKQVRLE